MGLILCVVAVAAGPASARVRVSVGFGIGGYCHPHGWYDGWCGYVGPGPWHWHPYGPVLWPGPGLWVYDCPPVVLERAPVVKRHVVVEEPPRPLAPPVESPVVREKLTQEKSELLKRLRIGDVDHRLEAVQELGRFAHDGGVRDAVERALLSDRDAGVRKAVAELLGRLGDKRSVSVLRRAHAEDSDEGVRQAAYKALILIEGY